MVTLEKWRVYALDPHNYGVWFERLEPLEPFGANWQTYVMFVRPDEYRKYAIGDRVDIEHTDTFVIKGLSL